MASIYSANKGQSRVYETDVIGVVSFKAVENKDGTKECFVKREEEGFFKPYGLENFETIVMLTEYQLKECTE